jgi:hypothetical protein
MNYGQPSAAQMEYMNNNPVENHSYISNGYNYISSGYLNQETFANGMKVQNRMYYYPESGNMDSPFKGLTSKTIVCPDCIDPNTIGENFFRLTYPGGENPRSYNGKYNYSYVPKDISEYPAIGHDRRYDNLKVAGASGLITDTRAIGADYEFVAQELKIAASPYFSTKERIHAASLGIGLGLLALPKTIYHSVTLGQYVFFIDVSLWYSISSQGVTNQPSIHKH